jgi:LAO/AO transport system kinase
MLLCEAAGYDVLLVETVGVGQSEYAVASMVDFFLVLMLAGAGDELQGIKRWILELADALAINKADGDNVRAAGRARAEYQAAFHLMRAGASWEPPVLTVSAQEGSGIGEIWDAIVRHRKQTTESGELEKKRSHQQHRWFWTLIEQGMKARFLARPDVAAALADVERALAQKTLAPTAAARRILDLVDK